MPPPMLKGAGGTRVKKHSDESMGCAAINPRFVLEAGMIDGVKKSSVNTPGGILLPDIFKLFEPTECRT